MKLTILLLGILAICVVNGEEPGLVEATTENQNAEKLNTEPDDKIQSRIFDSDFPQVKDTDVGTGLDVALLRRFDTKKKNRGERYAHVEAKTKGGGKFSFGRETKAKISIKSGGKKGGGRHSWEYFDSGSDGGGGGGKTHDGNCKHPEKSRDCGGKSSGSGGNSDGSSRSSESRYESNSYDHDEDSSQSSDSRSESLASKDSSYKESKGDGYGYIIKTGHDRGKQSLYSHQDEYYEEIGGKRSNKKGSRPPRRGGKCGRGKGRVKKSTKHEDGVISEEAK